jgi:alpha-ribazole phosphatase
MKLWLARHAAPLVQPGVCYGMSDVAADALATRQAAQALARRLPTGLAVRCSPLRRCRQLAHALRALRPELVPCEDPRLAEMDFGRWEGRPWSEVAQQEYEDWTADFPGYRCGGGENVAALMQRVAQALATTRSAGPDALWITHAGVVRALRLLAAGVALPARAADWPREPLAFGQALCIDWPQETSPRVNAVEAADCPSPALRSILG